MRATGASRGIIGVKEKNASAVEAITKALDGKDMSIHLLGISILPVTNTSRLRSHQAPDPSAGIPLDVQVVVNNVETLYNIARAADGAPVTQKWITVAGAVRTPRYIPGPAWHVVPGRAGGCRRSGCS